MKNILFILAHYKLKMIPTILMIKYILIGALAVGGVVAAIYLLILIIGCVRVAVIKYLNIGNDRPWRPHTLKFNYENVKYYGETGLLGLMGIIFVLIIIINLCFIGFIILN